MKKMSGKKALPHSVDGRIHVIRGRKVMLDADLAALYGVSTKAFNQAVKRNPSRFPSDFMFQLSWEEMKNLRSQIVTSSLERIEYQHDTNMRSQIVTTSYRRKSHLPYAFTEQGVAMLSSVLRSERAIEVNIAIMRAFVRLREAVAAHKDFATRIEKLEGGQKQAAAVMEIIIEDIDKLAREVKDMKIQPPALKRKIGFIL